MPGPSAWLKQGRHGAFVVRGQSTGECLALAEPRKSRALSTIISMVAAIEKVSAPGL